MPLPSLSLVALDAALRECLARLPAAAGVGQILGPEARNLLIGRPANLRRWAASHLGLGRPVARGRRPPTNLASLATAIAHAPTTSHFQQRLLYERLMARHVPPAARRDLKAPVFLHLDPAQRFPRVSLSAGREGPHALFGPFRDRRAAERARDGLHKQFPLRPCEFVFEPDPALALGQGCLYAQVRTCAAPCLVRISEGDYRELAQRAARFLADPERRSAEALAWIPPWVSSLGDGRGLVVTRGRDGLELYPVSRGRVLEQRSVSAPEEQAAAAVERLRWDPDPDPAEAGAASDDWPWLSGWIHSPRGRGSYITLATPQDRARLLSAVEVALGQR